MKKLIGNITGATISLDEEQNLYWMEPDNSEGFYFDEQDLSGICESLHDEIKNLIESN